MTRGGKIPRIVFMVGDREVHNICSEIKQVEPDTPESSVEIVSNMAFARGGAHLPIAHALRLLSTQELRFGLTKLKLRKSHFFCF